MGYSPSPQARTTAGGRAVRAGCNRDRFLAVLQGPRPGRPGRLRVVYRRRSRASAPDRRSLRSSCQPQQPAGRPLRAAAGSAVSRRPPVARPAGSGESHVAPTAASAPGRLTWAQCGTRRRPRPYLLSSASRHRSRRDRRSGPPRPQWQGQGCRLVGCDPRPSRPPSACRVRSFPHSGRPAPGGGHDAAAGWRPTRGAAGAPPSDPGRRRR
jgi:hypothetical protein